MTPSCPIGTPRAARGLTVGTPVPCTAVGHTLPSISKDLRVPPPASRKPPSSGCRGGRAVLQCSVYEALSRSQLNCIRAGTEEVSVGHTPYPAIEQSFPTAPSASTQLHPYGNGVKRDATERRHQWPEDRCGLRGHIPGVCALTGKLGSSALKTHLASAHQDDRYQASLQGPDIFSNIPLKVPPTHAHCLILKPLL